MSKMKSFRGKLANDSKERIRLQTKNGLTGYRIKQFRLVGTAPGVAGSAESVAKVYSVDQLLIDGLVDFSDNTLLAVALWSSSSDSWLSYDTVIFDNVIFNQDIYVTFTDEQGNISGNYYLELEQMPLDINESTVATLKDLKENTQNPV
jgi:hypothetical protein